MKILLKPIKEMLGNQLESMITDSVNGAVDSIVGSVGAAIDAAIKSTADTIRLKIHSVIDPQIARIQLKLTQVFGKVSALLSPIFTRLQSLARIEIGTNFSTISDVEVDITTIGLSHATAFVGLPPSGGFDWTKPLADQNAVGLVVDNLNLALGLFKPVMGKELPSFTAAKISADSAGFISGGLGADVLI